MRNRLLTLAVLLVAGASLAVIFDGSRAADDFPVATSTDREAVQAAAKPGSPPQETFARVFEACAHCHQIGDGARATNGPALTGIVGKPVASTDYPYSAAMRTSGLIWNEATLRDFLADPAEIVPGSRMRFDGLPEGDIGPMIEFLKNPVSDTSG